MMDPPYSSAYTTDLNEDPPYSSAYTTDLNKDPLTVLPIRLI